MSEKKRCRVAVVPGHRWTRVGALVLVDWYPTLLKLAGATLDQQLPIDGGDAWPAIVRGEPSPHEAILLNSTPGGGAIRVGDWKFVLKTSADNGETRPQASPAIAARISEELFRLADDPYEKHNLAAENPLKS